MSGKDIRDKAMGILKQVAPTIGTAIGGPFGGMAARAITGALLGKETDDAQAAAEALLAASPEHLLKLKTAEMEFGKALKALDPDADRIAAGDRDSARRMAAETGTRMPALIALAALMGFFGILASMVFVDIPAGAKDPLNIMLGTLGGLVLAIGNFYFGSSAGSSAKNAMLERVITRGERG